MEKIYLTSRSTLIFLLVLVCLFLIQRGGLLLFGYSHIAHPGFDETASGVLACDFLDGNVRAPLFVYQYEYRSGDSLIEGLLLIPFFKLFGRSLFSLKLFALASALISLLCWISFIKRYYGVWAAIIFASLFAFPPLMFARLNLVGTIGSHHVINPFLSAQLLFLFWIIERNDKMTPWFWLGFGFLSGLGAYTFYTYIIFDCFCLLFLLIFRSDRITFRNLCLFLGGVCAGFSPWVLRFLSSRSGGGYLTSILKNINIDVWSFIQNFGFNLPHSFGYNYPSRDIGIISLLFFLFILFFCGLILNNVNRSVVSLPNGFKNKLNNLSSPVLLGVFVVFFPLFFLICLSLSPMKIVPFEYWPKVGFFGLFNRADVYQYRWLHILFPFYFAIIAVGISILFNSSRKNKTYRLVAVVSLVFILLWGLFDATKLYSKSDFPKIFYYQGYDYDQMGNRFILSDIDYADVEKAKQIALNYPIENRSEIYRFLGTKVVFGLLSDSNRDKRLEESIKEVSPRYVEDYILGIVRAAQKITEKEFQPFQEFLIRRYPAIFYEKWGFRYLGHKYYTLLLNRQKILSNMSSGEKLFFKNILEKFDKQIGNREAEKACFLDEMAKIPIRYQPDMVRGMGMLVGLLMLFDPVYSVDYPLDSSFGARFNGTLKEAFYEGVGSGFAETLCRLWRRLLLPEDPASPLYGKMLDIEWERCHAMMSKVSPSYSAIIERGFIMELKKRHLPEGVVNYLQKRKPHVIQQDQKRNMIK